MKKIVISIIVVILISVGIVSCLYINNKNKKDEIKQNETSNKVIKNINEEEEEKENEPISEDIKNDNDDNKNISNNDDNTNKSNKEINSSSNSNVIKENKTQVQEEKHNDNNKVVQQPQVQPEKPVVKEEPKQQTEWEKLGISEYDYYNKPMWSWARIDYSIKDYGSFEQTHQACIDAGNKLEDILSFSCTNINSYSGAYLGDMLKVKY